MIILESMNETKTMDPNGNNNSNEISASNAQAGPARRDANWPEDALIILPLRNSVLFPLTLAPLSFGRKMSVAAVEEAVRREQSVGVVCQRDPKTDLPQPIDLYSVGTAAEVLRV